MAWHSKQFEHGGSHTQQTSDLFRTLTDSYREKLEGVSAAARADVVSAYANDPSHPERVRGFGIGFNGETFVTAENIPANKRASNADTSSQSPVAPIMYVMLLNR